MAECSGWSDILSLTVNILIESAGMAALCTYTVVIFSSYINYCYFIIYFTYICYH